MRIKSLLTLLLSTFLLCSCGSEPSYVDKSLTKIKLSGDYQTSFTIGDEFNYDGLVVTAYYSDSSSKTAISSVNSSFISSSKIFPHCVSEKSIFSSSKLNFSI